MSHWWQKIGIVAGTIASVAGALKDVPLVPAQYQPVVVAVGTIAAAVAGLYHPPPVPVIGAITNPIRGNLFRSGDLQ